MPRTKKSDTGHPIESYAHTDKERLNNPPIGLVTPDTDPDAAAQTYQYDPHLDPQLVWAGKAEHTSFEVPTVSLHVHERIDPLTIVGAVRRAPDPDAAAQLSLFETAIENPPIRDAIDFYRHPHGWSNRLVAGDSLLVMNSLLEKEGMAGKVQMVYFDPPYGIKYGSNFQPFVNKRDVKDGKDEDLTAEPEQIRAFRDTWELGIHSYLTYLRDRLLLARELLTESGSVFVQISDENVHHVREIMDESFGVKNFCGLIAFAKTSSFTSEILSSAYDYLVWYAQDRTQVKFRPLWQAKRERTEGGTYTWLEPEDGENRRLTSKEIRGEVEIPKGKRFRADTIVSPGPTQSGSKPVLFDGVEYLPSPGSHWMLMIL
jgi:adenine-specific DNA-methyltransferase